MWVELGLVKAGVANARDPWMIYIQASAPTVDHEGEVVAPQALHDAADYLLRNGKVSFEHIDRATRHDPSILIGEPTSVRVTPDGRTLVAARLYEHQPKVQAVWNILQSGGHLKASIGGAVLARDPADDSHITKILWTHLALTSFPVNEDTNVQLTPYAEFLKALGATVGTSAQPLIHEDLEGAMLRGTPAFEAKWRALTDTLVRTRGVSVTAAKELALAHLVRSGEARQAYLSHPAYLTPDTKED